MLSVKNKVNSRLKEKLKTESNAPYHDKTLAFSSTLQDVPTVFPTLNVVSLGEPQTGNDLERKTQNFIISTIQIKGYTNTSYTDAYNLVNAAGDVMISMGYELIVGIEDISDSSTKIAMARFRRTWGTGDIGIEFLQ